MTGGGIPVSDSRSFLGVGASHMHHEFIFPLSYRSAATRLAVAFVLWSAVWVVTSDYLLHFLFGSGFDFWPLETGKGLIYVAVSGVLLWLSARATERDDAARRAANESKLRSLKESGLIGVSSWGSDGKITYVNETLAQMLEYAEPEIIGTDGKQYIPAEYAETYRRAELELHLCGRTSIHELQLIRKDGARVPVLGGRALVEGADGGGIGYFLDISELKSSEAQRKLLEAELLHSERLNALGQLAGAVAHDFNNQLAVIMGYAALLEANLGSDESSRRNVEQVFRAADRARSLIRQLLAFSRKQVLQPKVLDLNTVLKETDPMLRRLLPESIQLVLKLSPEQQLVEMDEAQFEQVLLNLVVNARDAMPEGGVLTLNVFDSTVESKELTLGPSEHVILEVCDTGLGIEDLTKERIFEPFFTTKQYRGGTGLGLSTVYGIITQSGGNISVDSAIGKGTTFKVKLPRLQNSHLEPKVLVRPKVDFAPLVGTVLLVEDLRELREATAQILAQNGLQVLQAKDGMEAVQVALRHTRIDLVLSDIAMPLLSGPDAVSRIRKSHPRVKVIFSSGYFDIDIGCEYDLLLAKPITAEVLITSIRTLLESSSPHASMPRSDMKNPAA
jgi:two-component system cell cycle sensor histidine kinase/response regulator CckA